MKALLIVFVSVGTPLTVICVRVGQNVVDDGVRAIMYAIAACIVMVGVAILLHAIATIRQAQWAKPSHNIAIDKREQHIDARRQSLVVDAAGHPVELPAGQKIVEVMQ